MSRDKNNKDGRQIRLDKHSLFRQKINVLHRYKGILLVKLLWQNQNCQLVLGGVRIRKGLSSLYYLKFLPWHLLIEKMCVVVAFKYILTFSGFLNVFF